MSLLERLGMANFAPKPAGFKSKVRFQKRNYTTTPVINLTLEGDVSVLLVGLVNPKADSKAGLERGFRADRFRPLQELREKQTATNAVEKKKELTQPIEVG